MQTDNAVQTWLSASGPPEPEERPVSIRNLNSGPTGQIFHYQTDPCEYIPQTPDKLWNNSSPFSPVCDFCWSKGSWRDTKKLPMLTNNDVRRKKKKTKHKTMLSVMNRLISKNLLQILLLVLLIMSDIVWLSKIKSWHVTSLGQLSFLLYWFGALEGKMISDLTHPESPKMMTFKSTFFLEVILLQLEEDKEQMFRQGCISNAPLRHCIIKIHKPFHQTLLHVCAGNWTNQLRGPHMRHVISKLLTESRGTHHSFVCAHRKSRPGGLTPLLLILKNHSFYFWQCCWAPLEQKSVHVSTGRAYNCSRNISLKRMFFIYWWAVSTALLKSPG